MILAGQQFDERSLLEMAVRNMRPSKDQPVRVRWALVRDAFGLGSMAAYAMCREFKLDPEEKVNP
ncbi:hypothetical protein GZ982_29960 (plasmid) [Pseudomonas fluorescens]|nr:hypothetical protein GZ982_29960 [Pseudomonas fluorescens]